MKPDKASGLAQIRDRIDALGAADQTRTGLASIYGAGAINQPDRALVFINPTYRNTSSQPNWLGPRFPFIGTHRIWQFLARVGWLDQPIVEQLPMKPTDWSPATAKRLEQELVRADLYLTNAVKATGADSQLPPMATVTRYRQVLHDELELIQPRLTIAFGAISYRALTGKAVRLADAYAHTLGGQPLISTSCRGLPVTPCYFPVGRGNPGRAREMLRLI